MKQTVDKHIVTLLQEHDCVIIPEFGGLISQYTPVRIHPVRHSMAPPAKRIAFNEKLKLNDGRLVSQISLKEHLSAADAALRVNLFVKTVNLALEQQQRYLLQDVGLFKKEPGLPIEFEYEEKINLLADSFGLPEVFSKPVQRHRSLSEIRTAVQEKVAMPQPKIGEEGKTISLWRKTLRYAALIPILALSASAVYLAGLNSGLELSTLNPVSYVFQQRPAFVDQWLAEDKPELQIRSLTEQERSQYLQAFQLESPAAEPAPTYLTDQFLLLETGQEVAFPEELPAEETAPAADLSDWDTPATEPNRVAAAPEVERAKPVSDGFAAPDIIKETTGRFYIIAGGFVEPANARHLQKRARKNGLEAQIIEPSAGSRLHRVSLASFETKEQAQQQIPELTTTYGKALWVLEY